MSDIYIYDDIGPDWMGMVSSKTILSELEKVGRGKPVTVRINSRSEEHTSELQSH